MKRTFVFLLSTVMALSALAIVRAPVAQSVTPGGPLVLMGIDAEDCGPGGHGPIANYIQLVDSVLADVTNASTGGILVVGGKPGSCAESFWNAIGAGVDAGAADATAGETVTHVSTAAGIAAQSFAGFELIAVVGSELNTFGGLTSAENDALVARESDVANFVNAGGGLVGFDQDGFAAPFDYVGALGTFTTVNDFYSDIDPTPAGTAVGADNNLDVCCWHQTFSSYPSFLTVLAYKAGTLEVAALGGEAVVVPPEDCTNGIDDDGDGLVDGADPDCQGVPPTGETIEGAKYYDANTNGTRDAGEPGIENWLVDVTSGATFTAFTDATGDFSVDVDPGTYTVAEQPGGGNWVQTGNSADQSTGTADVTLNADKTYTVAVGAGESAAGLNFGNVCTGPGGARTKGFWGNKNGAALFNTDSTDALAALVALNLRNEDGTAFNPTSWTQLERWLKNARSVNQAYMLSAQLAAMALNVHFGLVDADALILADGSGVENAANFATVQQVMDAAHTSLGLDGNTPAGDPNRALQGVLSGILDAANNNLNVYVQAPADCAAPVFPFAFADNFNAENAGVGALNYAGFANWGVSAGTVDLIGNGFFDFYPGQGLYVDLDGSTGDAGVLTTQDTFALLPGTYQLSFKLGGSTRGDVNSVDISLGTLFSDTYVLASADPLATVTVNVVVAAAANAQLSVSNAGGDNLGAILDDVSLTRLP